MCNEETFGVVEAAKILRVHQNTVLRLAKSGELRGAKIGKSWVFLVEDVRSYLRSTVRRQTNRRLERSAEGFAPRTRRRLSAPPSLD
jgi:excisionase family DNA binding protein